MPTFYEFFAGGGMARAGLGSGWECLFANDIDKKKAASYAANWTSKSLKTGDVGSLSTSDLPGAPDLIWASFPCQDLSLAGNYLGLNGDRSGTFWPFWNLVRGLKAEQRHPALIVLENVCGALTSHNGRDFRSILKAVWDAGYNVGAIVVDAAQFVPQSRPRLFVIAVRSDMPIPDELKLDGPSGPFHTPAIEKAHNRLAEADKKCWIWWNLPVAPPRTKSFSDVIEDGVLWHSPSQTRALLDLMLPRHRAKVIRARKMNKRVIGTVYKRTRPDDNGIKAQRAEVRFDETAGCLRTPGGGSSRQSVLVVEGNEVRSRLLTPREAARLMGLNEGYILPEKYNEAYHLMGDGVVVPVVSHIANNLLNPILENGKALAESVA
jgi:DNA (cytosine-5)-methyltransferase 1